MPFQITVQPDGRQFDCNEDDTILNAGLLASFGLPHSCKNGACGSCKGKILSGQFVHGKHQEKNLTEEEKQQGYALFCCAKPLSDLTIEVQDVKVGEFPCRKLPARIAKIEKLSSDVLLVCLQLPATDQFNFNAGQYIDFLLKNGKRRSYSIANAAAANNQVTLHIRHMPGGLFTDQAFSTLKERDIFRIEGPQGTFFLREDSDKPIILLASGTGFAPLKSIIEHATEKKITRPVTLYWGGRRPDDLYMNQLCQDWAKNLPDFTYIPVISDALPEDNWTGRRGFVHLAVMEDIKDMSGVQVYACGAPVMVNAARSDFVHLAKLPVDEFYSDAFISEADLA